MSLCVHHHRDLHWATFELTQLCAGSDWGEVGRKPYATVAELETIAKQELNVHGATIGKTDLARRLTKLRETQLQEAGFSTIGNFAKPHQRTVTNTLKLMKSLDGVKLVKKPVHKTEARSVAETSLLSAYTFAVTAAGSHFVVGERGAGYVPLATPDAGVVSTGTPSGRKSLLDMVSEANGGFPVYPVHPSMVFSTDDTTLFVFEGQDVSGGEKLGSDSESGSIHGHFRHGQSQKRSSSAIDGHDVCWRFPRAAVPHSDGPV
jgi:hypothetical protein